MADPSDDIETFDLLEPDEPPKPRSAAPSAPQYLPRSWKAEPEPNAGESPTRKGTRNGKNPTEAATPRPRSKPKAKPARKQPAEPIEDDGTGAVKLEETPVLDTYEARQRVRWAVGGVLALVGLIGVIVLARAFRGPSAVEEAAPAPVRPNDAAIAARSTAEVEAENLVESARQADRGGKLESAVNLLQKAVKTYPATAAGREAMAALDRHRRHRPIFGPDQPEQANGPKPPEATAVASPTSRGDGAPPTAPVPPPKPADPPTPTIVARALPGGFHPAPGSSILPGGWPARVVSERDEALMVLVPGGTYPIGRDDGEADERPARSVILSPFYIDEHEVTARQYARHLADSGRAVEPTRAASTGAAGADLPVANVNAREARAYCTRMGKRLPTEAQWEAAARSHDGRIGFGAEVAARLNSPKETRALAGVMTFAADVAPCGAFDLAGNALEWTSDSFDPQYFRTLRDGALDPDGPPSTSRTRLPNQVTVKGGSKQGYLTWRDGRKIDAKAADLGFRGVLIVEEAPRTNPSANPTGPNPNQPAPAVPF